MAGSATAGANQNGSVIGPYGTPGELVSVAGADDINAATPAITSDWRDLFVETMYDLDIMEPLQEKLIFEQFFDVRNSRTTHNGGTRRISLVDDLAEATDPLVENRDVDAVGLDGRYTLVRQREYGNALTRTELVRGHSMIPFDPEASRKLALNAGKTIDTLARTAAFTTTTTWYDAQDNAITGNIAQLAPTYASGASAGYLATEVLQEGVVLLGEQYAEPLDMESYVLLAGDRGIQHLKADSGWRNVVQYNEGSNGNSLFRGYVGTYEGVHVVRSNRLTNGKALLFGREAFIKVFPQMEGFGPMPQSVVSPVTDKLKRFASVGWKHLVGHQILRGESVVQITHTTLNRSLTDVNTAIGATAYSES